MIFYPDFSPYKAAAYSAVPPQLHRRLLAGFTPRYVQGGWGWMLEQRMVLPIATGWLFDLEVFQATRFLATSDRAFFGIGHVLTGSMRWLPGHAPSFGLPSGSSAALYIPPSAPWPVQFSQGRHQWWMVDWQPGFLRERGLFPELLQRAVQDPVSFYGTLQTIVYPWESVWKLLEQERDPSLLLETRLLDALRVYHPPALEAGKEWEGKIRAARELMEAQLDEDWTIRRIARRVSINESALKKGFKQLYGITVHECLYEARMQHAMQLLQQTDRLVQDIAAVCGYNYPSHFAKMFLRRFGVGPQAVRTSPAGG